VNCLQNPSESFSFLSLAIRISPFCRELLFGTHILLIRPYFCGSSMLLDHFTHCINGKIPESQPSLTPPGVSSINYFIMSTSPQVAVDEEQPKPWYAAYPAQRNSASWVTKQTLLSWMEKGEIAGKDFILVDLRRTDFEVSVSREIYFAWPLRLLRIFHREEQFVDRLIYLLNLCIPLFLLCIPCSQKQELLV